MGLFSKIFGNNKKDALEKFGQMFDEARAYYTKIIIDGLSDPDIFQRQGYIDILRDSVLPALLDDPHLTSRQLSIQTIECLISELRPPKSKAEFDDFINAMYYFTKRQVLSGQ